MDEYSSNYAGTQVDSAVAIALALQAWAKASTKPSYSFSEITGNLDGYNIMVDGVSLINSSGYINSSLLPTYDGTVE